MTIYDMKSHKPLGVLLAVLLAAGPAIVVAQQPPVATGVSRFATRTAQAVRAARAAQSNAARAAATATTGAATNAVAKATSVVGYLWTANDTAIGDATVQLRNTVTGQVEALTRTNGIGEFIFSNVDGGSYVVEYVEYAADQAASQLLALGHPFTVAPGQTVATFVRMSNVIPALIPDAVSNVAAAAVQGATSAGVTAVVTPIAPVVEQPPAPSSGVR